jgi:predicted DNA binding protein
MTYRARVVFEHDGCDSRRIRGSMHAARVSADHRWNLSLLQAATAPELEALLRIYLGRAPLGPVELLARGERAALVRQRVAGDDVDRAADEADCSFLLPLVNRDGREVLPVMARQRSDVQRFVAALERSGTVVAVDVVPAELASLALPVPLGQLFAGLTPRQMQALVDAIAGGYYASPRRASAHDLAAREGVEASTFSEHLRKAEGRVLGALAGAVAEYPFAMEWPARRRGRPRKRPGKP